MLHGMIMRVEECHLVKCAECGTFVTYPIASAHQLRDFYSGINCGRIFDRKLQRDSADPRIDAIKLSFLIGALEISGITAEYGKLNLLDIGAGTGDFVREARKMGFRAKGIDICGERPLCEKSREASEPGQSLFSSEPSLPDVMAMDLSEMAHRFGGTSPGWDIISLWDVLEHLPDPAASLRDINSLLRPGGIALLKVPSSMLPLYRLLHRTLSLTGLKMEDLTLPGHRFHFSWKGIASLVSGNMSASIVGFPSLPFQKDNSSLKGISRFFAHFLLGRLSSVPIIGPELEPHHVICLRKAAVSGMEKDGATEKLGESMSRQQAEKTVHDKLADHFRSDFHFWVVRALCASALIALLALPIVPVMVLSVIMQGLPVFFSHSRVGFRGRVFRLYKLRTMALKSGKIMRSKTAFKEQAAVMDETGCFGEADDGLITGRDDSRVTAIGRYLRKLSIDELPQLYNIMTGEMGFIGPRPDLPFQIKGYSWPFRKLRLSVHQGITGLAQVFGRSCLTPLQRRVLETYYVANRGFRMNLLILIRTFRSMTGGGNAW